MAKTLTKAVLADRLHARVGISKTEASAVVEDLLDIMKESLSRGEGVKVSGFGSFKVSDKAARPGHNPKTREPITISRRRVVTFKESGVLRGLMNPGRDQ